MDQYPVDSEQPTAPLRLCIGCGALVEGITPVCVACQNNHLLHLRLMAKTSHLTDWDVAHYNHIYMMHNAELVDLFKKQGAHIPYTRWLELIMQRAYQQDPFWREEVEEEHE